MARSYANIVTAIWAVAEWRALPAHAQHAYLMLVTQPDISAAGVLAITDRRWSGYASDITIDTLTESLEVLANARFLIIDWEGDELLVRSFVRHDKGYTNPKRRAAIFAACREVRSPTVRRALAAELRRLGLPSGDLEDPIESPLGSPSRTEGVSDSPSDSPSGAHHGQSIVTDQYGQVEGLSDSQSDTVSIDAGSVGGTGSTGSPHTPHSTTPHPPAGRRAEEAANFDQDEPAREHPGSSSLMFQAPPVASSGQDLPDPSRQAASNTADGPPRQADQDALVDAVRAIRPEWTRKAIHRALTHPDVLERPWTLTQHALLAIARDRATQAPGRLPHDGPWWTPPRRPDPPRRLASDDTDWRSLPDYGTPTSASVAAREAARLAARGGRPVPTGGTT
jgi:hypothetical protein